MPQTCKDCRTRIGVYDGRCARCRDRALAMSPPVIDPEDEWTEEELDALIAEQSKPENLPSWWERDVYIQSLRDGLHQMGWLLKRGRI